MNRPAGATRTLRRVGLACALAAWLALAATFAIAQDVLPVPALSGRVIDQTGTLDAAQRDALERKLAAFEQRAGSQLVVLIVPTTHPEDIASYAQRIADNWKIGRRDIGDGLLIVVAKNDRRVRIEVAKALEGAIPDLAARQVIDTAISPAFRAGDFAGGLNAGVDRLMQRISGEGLPAPDAQARRADAGPQWDELAIFFFVGVPVVGAVLTAMLGRKLGSLAAGGFAGAMSWWMTTSVLLGVAAGVMALALVGVLGIGAARRRFASRGGPFAGGAPPIFLPGGGGGGWGGSSGGGGFSSGGGGDFGGGGASGDW